MTTTPAGAPVPATPPSHWHHVWRIAGGTILFILLVLAGALWYATTQDFANRVRSYLVATLEKSTGGRVEIGAFHWQPLRLAIEMDNLTIHGLEAQGEVPYAHLDKLRIRAKILSFFSPKIGLSYLEADHPVVHLIVYKDGTTNQPRPKTPSTSSKPVTDTIFDLAIDRTLLNNGVAIVNQRAMPFNLAANKLAVIVSYAAARDHYVGTLRASDIVAQRGKSPDVHSELTLDVDAGRNSLTMPTLTFRSGRSVLHASASLNDFNQPRWTARVTGDVDLREINVIAQVGGIGGGVVYLDVDGHGASPRFDVSGKTRIRNAAYNSGNIHVMGVDADARLHLTQDALAVNNLSLTLAKGGVISGGFELTHWLAPAPQPNQPTPPVSQGSAKLDIAKLSLANVLAMAAPRQYQDLGFASEANGTITARWSGNAQDLAATANLALAPAVPPTAHQVPLSGNVNASYTRGSATIRQFHLQTPATTANLSGSLGVYPASLPSSLKVDITAGNLAEFSRVLTAAGLQKNGTLPISLLGQAQFQGRVTGTLAEPDAQGHLGVTSFDLHLPAATPPTQPVQPFAGTPQPDTQAAAATQALGAGAPAPARTIHIDSLQADAEYTPALVNIHQLTVMRGKTQIVTSGQLRAHRVSRRVTRFDDRSVINADARISDASLTDLMAIAGQTLPVTGTLNLQTHVGGELGNLNGGGHLTVMGGAAYGEPYKSLNADLRFAGKEVGATNLALLQNGGRVTGDGGFNLGSKQFHFDAQGSGFELAHIQQLQNQKYPLGGNLTFAAKGSGTAETPALQTSAHLRNLTVAGQSAGYVDLEAHTEGHNLLASLRANVESAQLELNARTQLTGDYQTTARLTLAHFDFEPYLKLLNVQGVTAPSLIAGQVNVAGPLKRPRALSGDAQLTQFKVQLANIPIESQGPLHTTLDKGVLRLDPLHITGPDTDLQMRGRIGLFDKPQAIAVHATGSLNVKLAQSVNQNITSSGRVDFNMDGSGTTQRPNLTGQVNFRDVNFSLQTFPNGISKMNGRLVFNQDRLQVQDLTAYSGGGKLTMGGFVTYQQGIFGDFTVSGKSVRVRYPPGLSSVVDTKLRIQGTAQNILISGDVRLTRFMVSPNIDFAAITGPGNAISPPPDPTAFTNHVRLDIHVVSAPELDFQNSYARLAGDVNLNVRGTVANPSVLGRIGITEGSATFSGAKYQLQHGEIYFNNPVRIDPIINLDATTRVENYDVTIGLHGTPSKLTPTFRSEPPLSQQDIFSLLAMGRTQEERAIYSQEQQQAGVNSTANTLLGGALNASISSRIQKLFGGGSVKIDPTFVNGLGNATARITVQENVGPNAVLTYATNVNSTQRQLIQGQFNLTQNLSVVAVRDEVGVFSLIFRLQKRYR